MLPGKQIDILYALHLYKFLNRNQLARLGIERYKSNFSKYINPLLASNLIKCQDARIVGLGYIYYLTKKGFVLLGSLRDISDQKESYPKRKPAMDSNVFHRTYAIDCQIELFCNCEEWGVEILFYEKDIDNSIRKNERKTRIRLSDFEHIEPDGVFKLSTPKGEKLFCLEFEHKDSMKKSMAKVSNYIKATNQKLVSAKYNHDRGHRTLFIYHDQKMKDRVMDRVVKEYGDVGSWFLFKSYDEVVPQISLEKSRYEISKRKNFLARWATTNREIVDLY